MLELQNRRVVLQVHLENIVKLMVRVDLILHKVLKCNMLHSHLSFRHCVCHHKVSRAYFERGIGFYEAFCDFLSAV